MKKLIAILLLAFAFDGCVASDVRYRPCHDLGTDMSVSANEYYSQCPMRDRGT
jgi:PBP1b-binding outer membrane lipoprotein LpoB